MAGTAAGALKAAASVIGLSPSAYTEHLRLGEKWCTKCKAWHPLKAFGVDRTRGDGLSVLCLESRRAKAHKTRKVFKRHGWLVRARDGDKLQARRRVNYLVEQGIMPRPNDRPCEDCGHLFLGGGFDRRHEYDHAKGYSTKFQLYVEPVCSACHHKREATRNG